MDEKYQSKTIQKALDVLNLFQQHNKLSFTDIKEKLGLNKTTLFRVLYTLEHNNYLNKDPNGRYELGINIFVLGHKISYENQIKRITSPVISDLARKTNLTVHIGILDKLQVVILNKGEPLNNLKMVSRIGSSVPAHCTGQGKTLLAFSKKETVEDIINYHGLKRFTPNTITNAEDLFEELEKIQKNGFAFDNAEHESKLNCVAIPIFSEDGDLKLALSISGLIEEFKNEVLIQEKLTKLKEAREIIINKLGYQK